MVSKKWQRTQSIVSHGGLAVGAALPLYLFEMPYPNWLKLFVIAVGYAVLIPLVRWLHRTYANTFVKVFKCDYEKASRIIQRTLNAQNLPFRKQNEANQITFHLLFGKMKLVVSDFELNMLLDEHLEPETATKLTLLPETAENSMQMAKLRLALDNSFALQGM